MKLLRLLHRLRELRFVSRRRLLLAGNTVSRGWDDCVRPMLRGEEEYANKKSLEKLKSGMEGEDTYIGNSTVNISKFLQPEQSSCVSRIIECEALQNNQLPCFPFLWRADTDGRGIDGNSSCIGSRVWFLTCVSLSVVILR